jgi:hypothetical protein
MVAMMAGQALLAESDQVLRRLLDYPDSAELLKSLSRRSR